MSKPPPIPVEHDNNTELWIPKNIQWTPTLTAILGRKDDPEDLAGRIKELLDHCRAVWLCVARDQDSKNGDVEYLGYFSDMAQDKFLLELGLQSHAEEIEFEVLRGTVNFDGTTKSRGEKGDLPQTTADPVSMLRWGTPQPPDYPVVLRVWRKNPKSGPVAHANALTCPDPTIPSTIGLD